jgi:hypothetical protein
MRADLQTLQRTTKIYHHDNVASKIFLPFLLHYPLHASCPSNSTHSNANASTPKRFRAYSNTIHPIDHLPTFVSPGPSSARNLPHQLRLVLWRTLSQYLLLNPSYLIGSRFPSDFASDFLCHLTFDSISHSAISRLVRQMQ